MAVLRMTSFNGMYAFWNTDVNLRKLHLNMQFLLHRSCPLQRPAISQCQNLLYEDRVRKERNILHTMQNRPFTCNVTFRSVRVTTVVVEEQLSIIYSECTVVVEEQLSIIYSECVCVCVALCIQHAKRMRRVISSSVVSPFLPHFSTLPH
jgi:hypothetical protein